MNSPFQTHFPKTLLAIDPGNDTGYSVWDSESGQLLDAGVTSIAGEVGRWTPDHLVIERPQIYLRSKADPDNIITLAINVGEWVQRYRGVPRTFVRPSEWKGNVDKAVMTRRIEADLTAHEQRICGRWRGPESVRHNMIDAVGLGKHLLKKWRLDRELAAGPKAAA